MARIPDAILLKPGKLDDAEMEIMRTHVAQGEEVVTGMGWLDGANAVVAGHHEKWNGSGYPRQLKAEQIPLAARIFAVADVFDALCSKRPYKEPMGFEAVMAILENVARRPAIRTLIQGAGVECLHLNGADAGAPTVDEKTAPQRLAGLIFGFFLGLFFGFRCDCRNLAV